MLALCVIYLNFGLITPMILKMFSINILLSSKLHALCFARWEKRGLFVKALLNGHVLDVHYFFSKMIMVINSETIMKRDCLMNHLT
jgi:hypothetical protein